MPTLISVTNRLKNPAPLLLPLMMACAFHLTGSRFAKAASPQEDGIRVQRIEQMFSDYRHKFPDTPVITVQELISQIDNPTLLLVDVRTAAEQRVSMIPHAVAQEAFEQNMVRFKKRKIICYCTIGYRSGLFAAKLRREGFDAYNLKGGVLAWAHAHREFVSNGNPTSRVHVYGSKWNLLPSGYEAIW